MPNLAIAAGGSKDSANEMVRVPDLPILKSQGIPVNAIAARVGFQCPRGDFGSLGMAQVSRAN